MKIVFITNNSFGEQGTPGTYELIDRMSLKADIEVFSRKYNGKNINIVFDKKDDYCIHEVDYSKYEDIEWMISRIISFNPHVLYFCSGQIWRFNEARIIRKVKENIPDVKAVLDIKSPPLIDDHLQLQQIREESSSYQYMLDKILSRSQEDIERWFSKVETECVLYPLGIPLDAFKSKKFYHDIIYCHRYVYIGALHKRRKIEKLLYFILQLPERVKCKISFDIYGSGPLDNDLKNIIEDKGLIDTVGIKGSIRQNSLFDVLKDYDAGIGWVPYQSYDFAPSLKSLEYISAGLVPLLSNTIAHQRLLEHEFNIEYFSMDPRSFTNAIRKLCFEGVSTSKISENLEIIKHHDWNTVIEDFIYPELKKMVKNKEAHTNISIGEEIFSEQQKQIPLQIQEQNILFIYDSEVVINSSSKNIVNCFKDVKINVAACCPLFQNFHDDSFFCEVPCFTWKKTQNCTEILKRALADISPQLIVLFYSGQGDSLTLSQLAGANTPVIVSERVPPERTIIQGTNSSQPNRSELAWQREILLASAECIHLQHESYLDSVPEFLHSRVEIFCDDITACSIKYNNNAQGLVTHRWSKLVSKALTMNNKGQPTCRDRISVERSMHANRIGEKLFQQINDEI
jgi:hypothetical protein